MRRFSLIILALVIGVLSLNSAAQETTAEPTTEPATVRQQQQIDTLPDTVTIPRDMLEDLLSAVERAEGAEERIVAAEERAFNLLGLFETLGLIVAVIGFLLGVIGLQRIYRAETELGKARAETEQMANELNALSERIQRENEQQKHELEVLPDQITGQLNTSFQQTQQAISLIPLAQQQFKSGNLEGALDIYLRASELDPNNPVTLYHIGYIYTQQNRVDEAIDRLKQAVEIAPNLQQVRAALGFAYRRKGQTQNDDAERDRYFEMARKELEVALINAPGLVDDDGESWWGSLGGLYKRRGRPGDMERALSAYREAAQITPKSSYPHLNLGILELMNNPRNGAYREHFAKARELATREIQARIDNYWAYGDLMMLHLVVDQDVEQAQHVLRDLLAVYPKDARDVMVNIRSSLQTIAETLLPVDRDTACLILRFMQDVRGAEEGDDVFDDAYHALMQQCEG